MTIAHVPLPAVNDTQCDRCGEPIEPPRYDSEVQMPVCFECRKRPTEGWTAFCHQCRCHGGAAAAPGLCKCGATWTGGRTCHCATCHLTFTTVGNFDAHFIGRIGAGRRCLTPTEFRDRGYEPSERGHWRKPAPEGTTWAGNSVASATARSAD